MGPGPDVRWLSSEMRNANSTCSYSSNQFQSFKNRKGPSKRTKLSFPSKASARCMSMYLGLCCVRYIFADFRKTRWAMPALDSDLPDRRTLHK